MMHWILQENLFKESEWDTLTYTLERFTLPYSVHKVVPFIGELIPPPAPRAPKVVCFGSYSMRHTAKKEGWKPGVYDLFEHDFLEQRSVWRDKMLNYDSQVLPFKDAVITEATFMRPIDDSKYFAGKVFGVDEFNEWQKNVCVLEHDYGNSMTKDTLIQVCTPKDIFAEYRFWVVNGKIITASLYKRGDRVIYSSEVDQRFYDFVDECVTTWRPHRAFVIDVCDTPDGLKIVEINTLNSAGFYAGNIQRLVEALEEMEA